MLARPCHPILHLLLAWAALTLLTTGLAEAKLLRVAVLDFEGDADYADTAREAILRIVDENHELFPPVRFGAVARRLRMSLRNPRSAADVARRAGVDALVEGRVTRGEGKFKVVVTVRESRTGRAVDAFQISLKEPEIPEGTFDELADQLLDLLEWTEPLQDAATAATPGGAGQWAQVPAGPGSPVAFLAPPPAAGTASTAASTAGAPASPTMAPPVAIADEAAAEKAGPPLFLVSGGAGLAVASRRLTFIQQSQLPAAAMPVPVRSAPTMGLALHAAAQYVPLGLALDLSYARSVGARLSFRDAGQTRQLTVTQDDLGIGLRAGTNVGRVRVEGLLGYEEMRYVLGARPSTLLIPDTRYSIVNAGGSVQVALAGGKVKLGLDAGYLHLLSSSGITDRNTFGSASSSGIRAGGGIEISASSSTLVKAGVHYTHIGLTFHGDGKWATSLDDDERQDVGGATDEYLSSYLLLECEL